MRSSHPRTAAARPGHGAGGQVDLASRGAVRRDVRAARCGSPTTCTPRTRPSTLNAIRALGADVSVESSGEVVIRGVGLSGARSPGAAIDVGNAGTLMRLLPGWLAAQEGREFELDGDASIRTRPVDRIAEPLRQMGADITATDGRFAPFVVRGTALKRDRLRAAGRERAGEVVRADRGPVGGRHDDRHRAGAEPRPHRADARRPRASRSCGPGRRSACRGVSALRGAEPDGPRRPVVGGVHVHGRRARSRGRACSSATSARTGRGSASCASSSGWAA